MKKRGSSLILILLAVVVFIVVTILIVSFLLWKSSDKIENEEPAKEGSTSSEEMSKEEIQPESICQNECVKEGLKACYNDTEYKVCGNYDSDNCSEWSSISYCENGTSCMIGNCIATNPVNSDVDYWAVLVFAPITEDYTESNEADLLKEMLISKNWKEDHIRVLKREEATHDNFLAALEWLADNSDSNDVILLSIDAHGSPTSILLANEYLMEYSEIAQELDKVNYKGLGIMLSACDSAEAIPILKKENRVIILPSASFPTTFNQALLGFGDIEGNNDNWVSLEEVYNIYSNIHLIESIIQDDYNGELNIVSPSTDLRYLDQYSIKGDHIDGMMVGPRMQNENSYLAQSFKPNYPILTGVRIDLSRENNPGPLTVSIRKDLSGSDLTSIILNQEEFYYEGNFPFSKFYEFDFPDIEVIPGETYYIVIGAPDAVYKPFTNNYYSVLYNAAYQEDYYSEGKLFTFYNPSSKEDGGVWYPVENDSRFSSFVTEPGFDLFFATFGKPK